jgi:peptidoglycan hydrolase-like protein with peptidoglycan-binding domain
MKKVSQMFALAAVTGLFAGPAWTQEPPSSKQSTYPGAYSYSGHVQSGDDQNMPPETSEFGRSGLSKGDIRKAEQALQANGYNPGRVDGVIDNQTHAAIRDFQVANSLPVTGSLDEQTAQMLGVS